MDFLLYLYRYITAVQCLTQNMHLVTTKMSISGLRAFSKICITSAFLQLEGGIEPPK